MEQVTIYSGLQAYTSEGIVVGSRFSQAVQAYLKGNLWKELGKGRHNQVLNLPGLSLLEDEPGSLHAGKPGPKCIVSINILTPKRAQLSGVKSIADFTWHHMKSGQFR